MPAHDPENLAPPKRRRWPKWLAGFAVVLLVAVVAVWMAVSSYAEDFIRKRIEEEANGAVSMGSLDVQFGGGVTVADLRLEDERGRLRVAMRRIEIGWSWMSLLREEVAADVLIEGFEGHAYREENGEWSVDVMKDSSSGQGGGGKPQQGRERDSGRRQRPGTHDPDGEASDWGFRGSFEVRDSRVVAHDPAGDSSVDDIRFAFAMPGVGEKASFHMGFALEDSTGYAGRAEVGGSLAGIGPDMSAESLTGELTYTFDQIDLSRLASVAAAFGLREFEGQLTGEGEWKIRSGLAMDGGGRLDLSGLRWIDDSGLERQVARLILRGTAELDSELNGKQSVHLEADDWFAADWTGERRVLSDGRSQATGQLRVDSDMDGIARAIGAFDERVFVEPPSGQWNLDTAVTMNWDDEELLDSEWDGTWNGSGVRLAIAAGQETFRLNERRMRLESKGVYRAATETWELTPLQIASSFLNGTVTATGTADGNATFDAALRYRPRELSVVLEPWLPSPLLGSEEESIELQFTGPLDEIDLHALLSGASGTGRIGLAEIDLNGLATAGALRLEMGGQKTKATGSLTANQGRLDLNAELDLHESGKPVSTASLRLDSLQTNAAVGDLLSKVHPAFAGGDSGQRSLGGLLNAQLDLTYAGVLPAGLFEGDTAKVDLGKLSGTLEFGIDGLKMRGFPLVETLFEGLTLPGARNLEFSPVTLEIRDGRLHYGEGWAWQLNGIATSFHGSIGLDRSLDLEWRVPVNEALSSRVGFFRHLKGETLVVPIGGTPDNLQFDLGGALERLAGRAVGGRLSEEIQERIGDKVPGDLGEGLDSILRGVTGGGEPDEAPAPTPTPPAPKATPAELLLAQADALYAQGDKAGAAKLYGKLRSDYRRDPIFDANRKKIRDRIREGEPPR